MAHFDDIYDIAADGYGIITAAQAPAARPRRVQARALSAHAPYNAYAEAVALGGGGAYLHGESVLAMHGLELVDPHAIEVATPKRARPRASAPRSTRTSPPSAWPTP